MISFKKIMPWLFGAAAVTTTGLLDGVPFLESLADFLSFGSDATLALAAVGVAGIASESANPAGTTVVTAATAPVTTENPEGVESANYLDDDLNPTLVKIRPRHSSRHNHSYDWQRREV
jgi:hypothetical protein